MMEPQSYTPQTCLGRRVTVESLDRQAQRNSVVSPRDAVPVERSGCSNSQLSRVKIMAGSGR